MQIGSAGHTHVGRRKENQDAIRIERVGESWLAAVADGMGGHKGGAHASRRALEVVTDCLRSGDSIQEAVHQANTVLNEESQRPELQGMGTTIVGVVVNGTHYHVFNVGDSRAYRIRPDGVKQITRDHSFVEDAVRAGTMSASAAAASRWGNALTRSLGGGDDAEVDVFGSFDGRGPEFLVLCSDGVYRTLPDTLMGEIVCGTSSVQSAAQALVDVAYRRGSDDNLSAVVIEFGIVPRSPKPIELPPPVDEQQRQARTMGVPDQAPQRSADPGSGQAPGRLQPPVEAPRGNGRRGRGAVPYAAVALAAVVGLLGWLGWRGVGPAEGGEAVRAGVPLPVQPAGDTTAGTTPADSVVPPPSTDDSAEGGDPAPPAPGGDR